jgi:hypothetical protein
LNKPDGGVGWASRFLEQGYEVYVVDETTRGRSPWWPDGGFTQSVFSAEFISERFTAVQDSDEWPQAKLHTQWPGVSHNLAPATSIVSMVSAINQQWLTMVPADWQDW